MKIRCLAEGEDGDIYIGADGDLVTIDPSIEAVAQQCEAAMQVYLGECAYDQKRGRPDGLISFTPNPNLLTFEYFSRNLLTTVPDVVSVRSFVVVKINEQIYYRAEIQTKYGVTRIGL